MFACERKQNTLFVCYAKPRPTFQLTHQCIGHDQSANAQTSLNKRFNEPDGSRGSEIYVNYKAVVELLLLPRQAENRKSTSLTLDFRKIKRHGAKSFWTAEAEIKVFKFRCLTLDLWQSRVVFRVFSEAHSLPKSKHDFFFIFVMGESYN